MAYASLARPGWLRLIKAWANRHRYSLLHRHSRKRTILCNGTHPHQDRFRNWLLRLHLRCYELASLRDEDTGKGYCPACAKDHLELNAGAGIPQPAPVHVTANSSSNGKSAAMPSPLILPGVCADGAASAPPLLYCPGPVYPFL